MNKVEKFGPEIIDELQNYVYRLIDPRKGNTFYVGRRKGNRLISHVYEAQVDNEQDEVSAKIKTIREIQSRGYEAIHVIQRWGLTDKEAIEVESTLIDTIPGLDNLKSGDRSDRGATTAKEIIERFSAEEFKINPNDEKFIVIKIRQDYVNERGIYDTTRSAWKVNYNKVNNYKIALSVINGIVKEVYRISCWKRDEARERWFFEGAPAEESVFLKYLNKRLTDKFNKKGLASPVLYSDNKD